MTCKQKRKRTIAHRHKCSPCITPTFEVLLPRLTGNDRPFVGITIDLEFGFGEQLLLLGFSQDRPLYSSDINFRKGNVFADIEVKAL